jgi:hypothetical protein
MILLMLWNKIKATQFFRPQNRNDAKPPSLYEELSALGGSNEYCIHGGKKLRTSAKTMPGTIQAL